MSNWYPIILFFILLFGMGSVCLLALDVSGLSLDNVTQNTEANETFILRGVPIGIIGGTTNPEVTEENTFLGFVFPAGFNFSFINNSQIDFHQAPPEALSKKPTILGKFILAISLLPDIILYPFLIIESTLLIVGIIKLLPFQA